MEIDTYRFFTYNNYNNVPQAGLLVCFDTGYTILQLGLPYTCSNLFFVDQPLNDEDMLAFMDLSGNLHGVQTTEFLNFEQFMKEAPDIVHQVMAKENTSDQGSEANSEVVDNQQEGRGSQISVADSDETERDGRFNSHTTHQGGWFYTPLKPFILIINYLRKGLFRKRA